MRTLRPGARRTRVSKFALAWARSMRSARRMTKFAFRVAWRRRGQLHLSGLARAVRRDRHDDISEFESASPRPPEHDPGRLDDRRPRRRDQNVDLARVGSARPDDEGAVRAAGAASGQRRQSNDPEDAGPRERAISRRAEPPPARPTPASSRERCCVSRTSGRPEKALLATRIRLAPTDRTCRFSPARPASGSASRTNRSPPARLRR